jgi:serine phosphatase RsbU (regulator of sigma subunit)
MEDIIGDIRSSMRRLTGELENFQDIARYIKPLPGEVPEIPGVEIYGETMPLNGIVGGDHIVYVDFNKRYDLDARIRKAQAEGRLEVAAHLERCKRKAGIVVADVSGHQITDALLAAMLHQGFLLGVIYELDFNGNVTERLFENLNTRFYNSSSISKFLTMIYGEIYDDGTFKFISAAHPLPVIFSRKFDKIVDVPHQVTFPPIGTLPSQSDIDRRANKSVLGYKDPYQVNELDLMGGGDIMILYTDGLLEHTRDEEEYFPAHLEAKLREVKDLPAREIYEAIKQDVLDFDDPDDDISFVVIKRN